VSSKNKHAVPKKQWRKWSTAARQMFNGTMANMRPKMQWVFLHPDALPRPTLHWQTTRWNAAWLAADLVDGIVPIIKK
jgi:hypothetical protein